MKAIDPDGYVSCCFLEAKSRASVGNARAYKNKQIKPIVRSKASKTTTMKRMCLIAALAGTLGGFSASATSFLITDIVRVSGYFSGTGGEFTVLPGDATGQAILGNGYAPSTLVTVNGITGWQSFCMEQHEGLLGGPYTGTLNDRA